jgi:hypothetical protein
MRDHCAIERALRKRHLRSVGRLRAVQRIFVSAATPRLAAIHQTHKHIHGHVAVTIPVTRQHSFAHRHIMRTVHSAPVIVSSVSPVPISEAPAHPQRDWSVRAVPAAVQRAVAPPQRELTVITTRHETRVTGVECVVPKNSPAHAPLEHRQTQRPPTAFVDATPPHPQSSQGAPSPAELATITNHVLTAIDQRLIARNERLGRG